jgi:hypothetical protein
MMFALVLAAGPLMVGGCGDDGTDPADPQDTSLSDEEIATASEITAAFGAIFQIGTTVQAAIQEALSHPSVPAGLSPTTCPTAHIDGAGQGYIEMTLDYGAGCTTETGSTASGALHAAYRAGTPVDTIRVQFDSFTVDGSTINGDLRAYGSGTAWTFSFDGTFTDGTESAGLAATFGLVVDLAGTPADPSDDTETIIGSGTYSQATLTYAIVIIQPLVIAPGCAYPTSGVLTYQLQTDHATSVTTVDFTAGDCCTVLVSIGARSEEMSICEAP